MKTPPVSYFLREAVPNSFHIFFTLQTPAKIPSQFTALHNSHDSIFYAKKPLDLDKHLKFVNTIDISKVQH